MAAIPMRVWLTFMIITLWVDGGVASSVPSTVYIGKLFVYLLTHFKTFDYFVFL